MKITRVSANNRKRAFEVATRGGFTYVLDSGKEGTVHMDHVMEYNQDPNYLADTLLYNLTVEARKRVEQSDLSTREIIRRLGTSASQFYRLLDQKNYSKSLKQMVALLAVLGCEVDLVVRRSGYMVH